MFLSKTENRILKAEAFLNEEIHSLNQKLETYSSILDSKIVKLPSNVQVKKGKLIKEDCDFKEKNENINCIRIEVINFKFTESGNTEGDFKKCLTLFFDSSGKLIKIKSLVYSDSFITSEKQVIEILDTDPQSKNIEESVFIRFQTPEKIPSSENIVQYYDKKFIPFKSIENSKVSPIRNQLKREAYIKHLKSFEQLLGRLEFNSS